MNRNNFLTGFLVGLLFLPQVVMAYSLEVDGNKIDISGEQIKVDSGSGELTVTDEGVTVNNNEGTASVSEDTINIVTNGENSEELVVGSDSVSYNEEIGDIMLQELPKVEEAEGTTSNIVFKGTKDNTLLFDESGNEVRVEIGSKGIKVSDNLGSVVVYYANSGIENSGIKIGDKSGAIYLQTDFGEKKIGVLPLKIVRGMVNQNIRIEKSQFEWGLSGETLNYAVSGKKRLRLLWIIPLTIDETHLYNVENGQLTTINRSGWQEVLNKISF